MNEDIIAALERYPYLAERTRQLVEAADFVVALASEKWPKGIRVGDPNHYSISFRALSDKFGISFDPYDSQTDMFLMLLNGLPEIELARCGADEFLINAMPVPEKAGPVVVPAADESDMFYRNDDNRLCVGYLRGDFGRSGNEFHHSWTDGNGDKNTREFKTEFQGVMDTLRLGILKDHKSSSEYCHSHPEAALPGGDGHRFGFKLETADRQYFIRCTTLRDDYFYVFAYEKAARILEQNRPTAEKPSVLDQIREARKAPPAPRKQKEGRGKDGPEL